MLFEMLEQRTLGPSITPYRNRNVTPYQFVEKFISVFISHPRAYERYIRAERFRNFGRRIKGTMSNFIITSKNVNYLFRAQGFAFRSSLFSNDRYQVV